MKHVFPNVAIVCLALVLGALAPGCDALEEHLDPAKVEARLRRDPTRPGKVGVLRALEVRSQAAAASKRLARRPDAACDTLSDEKVYDYAFSLNLERKLGERVLATWDEDRRVLRDAEGDLRVGMDAKFRSEIGMEGARHRTWIVTSDDVYAGEAPPDGEMVYGRQNADEATRARIESVGLGTLQTLLDAVPGGWTSRDEGAWSPGGSRLRCAPDEPGPRWIERFGARGTLIDASFSVTKNTRHFEGRWLLSDRSRLTVEFHDEVAAYDGDVAPPPPQDVVELQRDRTMARAQSLLASLTEQGLLEPFEQPALPPAADEQ